jgi:hypothetical protein
MPIGLTFWPMVRPYLPAADLTADVRHEDGDVAVPLHDAIAAALGAGANRFSTGAVSTMMRCTFSSSMSAPWLCSAFAIAIR